MTTKSAITRAKQQLRDAPALIKTHIFRPDEGTINYATIDGNMDKDQLKALILLLEDGVEYGEI